MFKSRISSALGVVSLGVLLAASVASAATQSLTIMTHLTDDQWKPYYAQFTKDTGINVNLVMQDWGTLDKLVTSVAGGAAPDLVNLDTSVLVQAADQGVIMDLAPLMAKDPDLKQADFYPSVLDAVGANGKIYGLPTGLDVYLLYYNRDMFNNAGIGDPPANWTYTDYLNDAKKMTQGQGDKKVWGSNFYLWNTAMLAGGGDFVTADGKFGMMKDSAIDAMQWAFDLAHKYGVAPKWGEIPEGFHKRLSSGRTATHQAGPWYARYNIIAAKSSMDWGIANPLKWEGGQSAAQIFLGGWAIPTDSKQKELAWKFIQWSQSKQGAKVENGIVSQIPTRRSLSTNNDLLVWNEFGKYKQILLNTVAVGRAMPFNSKANAVSQAVGEQIGAAEEGQISVRQALEQALPKVNAILAGK